MESQDPCYKDSVPYSGIGRLPEEGTSYRNVEKEAEVRGHTACEHIYSQRLSGRLWTSASMENFQLVLLRVFTILDYEIHVT